MVMFTFFAFDQKSPFLGQFGTKIQNCLFKVKFGTQTNLVNLEFNADVYFFRLRPENIHFGQIWSILANLYSE